jgi:hypothetical protein
VLPAGTLSGCAKTGAPPVGPEAQPDEVLALLELWATHFGYYNNRIDLEVGGDLSAFVTSDAQLTVHAPLWGTKAGEEKAISVLEVRQSLARLLRWARVARSDLHLARMPDDSAVCLFFTAKVYMAGLPFPVQRASVAMVFHTRRTDAGLRLHALHEWPAASVEAARELLVDQLGWPADTVFTPHAGLGARS